MDREAVQWLALSQHNGTPDILAFREEVSIRRLRIPGLYSSICNCIEAWRITHSWYARPCDAPSNILFKEVSPRHSYALL